MNKTCFVAMPTDVVRAYQTGALDANGQTPERHISAGDGVPCRHCLQLIPEGVPFLVLAHRPFPDVQPYAEVGPLFLHAESCERYVDKIEEVPEILESEQYIVRGYSADNRIVYGTGSVVPTGDIRAKAAALFEQPDVLYVHVRSAANNCFQCRVEPADD